LQHREGAKVKAEAVSRVENGEVRVREWRFAAGAETGWHRHEYDYVVVPLTDGILRIADGTGARRASGMNRGVGCKIVADGFTRAMEGSMNWNPKVVLTALGTAVGATTTAQVAFAQALPTHLIPAALALEAVAEAVAECARQGYTETAVLVDVDGVRQAVLRGDRAGAHTLDSAFEKAYTAASFKSDTSALVERSKTAPIAPLLAKLPNTLLFGGGLVIKIGDEVVGAIGASGAPGTDLDDGCARAGLDKIRDRLK
jgi:uncharacterized protein GlcG (DUF336 family)